MTDPADVWENKSDKDIVTAAEHLADYTIEGQQAILAELSRRGLEDWEGEEREAETVAEPDEPGLAGSWEDTDTVAERPRRAQVAEPSRRSSAVDRYRNAYRVAHSQVLMGTIIKVAGIVLAVLILLSALLNRGYPYQQTVPVAIGIALVVAGLANVLGVTVSARGEMLRASLDAAVHSSPFLTNEQRAEVMGIDL